MENKFIAFTITSDRTHPGFARLQRSAEKWGIFLQPVDAGGFKDYDEFINNKHLIIRECLKNLQLVGFERFLCLDAWDTVFVGKLPTTVFTTPHLTFGAEKNCYPNKELAPLYLDIGGMPYLNAGVIWGPIAEYLDRCPIHIGHDQGLWSEVYLQDCLVLLDRFSEVALNLHSTNPEDLSRFPDGVRYNPTGSWPAILHGNGKWPLPAWIGE
jgi:hypothetical protein